MSLENSTIESGGKPKAEQEAIFEAEKSPEEIEKKMLADSEKEVDGFKKNGEISLEDVEKKATVDGLQIDTKDKKELEGLSQEAKQAKDELRKEISGGGQLEKKDIDQEKTKELLKLGKEKIHEMYSKGESLTSEYKDLHSMLVEQENNSWKSEDKVDIVSLEEKLKNMGKKDAFEKTNIIEVTKDPNFEGSTIIKIRDIGGRIIGYALRKNSEGNLEGNRIGYMQDGSIGPVYQLHELDFKKIGEVGILEKYESVLSKEQSLEFAREEIKQTAKLEELEKKAGDFTEALGEMASIEIVEKYQNNYAIPAYQQVIRLKGLIESNNRESIDGIVEKEKPFNSISSIINDKKALCIHFLTGFSNANNKTSSAGIEASSSDTFSKRSKEAMKQLDTLIGLNPSISTSMFADSHNFEETWYRNSGQPIGVILREGECTEISSDDASSSSRSPKNRSGNGEIPTIQGINKVLSSEEKKYSQSGYNEFVVSESKVGALFLTTNKPIEKECLKRLMQENEHYGYPILIENKGRFYQAPKSDLENILNEGEESTIRIIDILKDSYEVTREAIRRSISNMEDEELKEKEKQCFDQYINNYELKPHFEWADELEVAVKTKNVFVLNNEIKKVEDYENSLAKELEVEGRLTERLVDYFNKNNQSEKNWTEEQEYTYVNGKEYDGWDPIPEGAVVETKKTKIEFWEYGETTLEPLAVSDNIIGICESSNFQRKSQRHLRVIKYPNGEVKRQSFERIDILSKTINRNGDEKIMPAHSCVAGETVKIINNEIKRTEVDNVINTETVFRPLRGAIEYGKQGLIINPDELEKEIFNAKYVTNKTKIKAVAYAFTMAEMCEKNNATTESEKWKNCAIKISGNPERYNFVVSKLNNDGTLKLDNEDIANL